MRVPLPPRTPAALWQPRLLAPPVSWSRRQSTSLVLATGRRPHGAGDGEECAGGSGSPRPAGSSASSSSADREWQRVEQIQAAWQEIEERKLRLEGLVERQDFGAAAAERDALRHLQLSARRLELAAAADAKAGAGVRHQLGGVIVHARYNYRGVIVGYDPICCAPDEWCQMMRVDSLPLGRNQPFYEVLVDERDRPGAQSCYVAQENVMPMRAPREVRHPLVPHFFSAFSPEEGGYVPSPLLRAAYPQDF